MVAEITLRPITEDDMEFLYEVYASTREEELMVTGWSDEEKGKFLRMQFHAQHTYYQEHYDNASFDVILSGDTPIGRLYVYRRPEVINLTDIALLPEHQGQGIGGRLVRDVLDEATAAGKPVKLYVENNNRAKQLYYRLGFQDVDKTEIYDVMEWNAEAKEQG